MGSDLKPCLPAQAGALIRRCLTSSFSTQYYTTPPTRNQEKSVIFIGGKELSWLERSNVTRMRPGDLLPSILGSPCLGCPFCIGPFHLWVKPLSRQTKRRVLLMNVTVLQLIAKFTSLPPQERMNHCSLNLGSASVIIEYSTVECSTGLEIGSIVPCFRWTWLKHRMLRKLPKRIPRRVRVWP